MARRATPAGGPFPVIGGPGHAGLTAFLKQYPKTLPALPKALLVVSAHWEQAVPTVSSAAQPEMVYDYSGFPPEVGWGRARAGGGGMRAVATKEEERLFLPARSLALGSPSLHCPCCTAPPTAQAYKLKYPAPGSPELAAKICSLLKVGWLGVTREQALLQPSQGAKRKTKRKQNKNNSKA